MILYAVLGVVVAGAVIAGLAWIIVRDARAGLDVSDRWRDEHLRERRDV